MAKHPETKAKDGKRPDGKRQDGKFQDAKPQDAKAAAKAAKASPKPPKAAKPAAAKMQIEGYMPRLKKHYEEVVRPKLIEEFGYKNALQVPVIEKIVLNMGVGESTADSKRASVAAADLALIAGQKPVITKARKAIAQFKVREGMPIGAMVTLRGDRMYEFLDRLVSVALPRVRDFKGVSPKAFDGNGNYTLGIREQIIFPEINYDQIEKVKGLNVTFVTTAVNDEHAMALLKHLGMPFRQ